MSAVPQARSSILSLDFLPVCQQAVRLSFHSFTEHATRSGCIGHCIRRMGFSIAFGIIFGVIGVVFTPQILRAMNTPENLLADSTLYVRIYFAGLIFILIYNIGSAILRAIGDSKRPLYYLMICCGINIVLDLVFVLVMRLGVLGVAVGTLVSQGVSAVLVTRTLMYHTEDLKLELKKIRIEKELMVTMLQIGLPTRNSVVHVQSLQYHRADLVKCAWCGYDGGVDGLWKG